MMPLVPCLPARSSSARVFQIANFVLLALLGLTPGSAIAQQPAPPPGEYYVADDEAPAQDVAVGVNGDEYADTDPSALSDFRATLDPHGTWVDDPTYGQLWVPNNDEVGPNFAPYVSEGSWAYDDDYTWVSNYAWGWVPFHYGRWAWTAGRWGWVPGQRLRGCVGELARRARRDTGTSGGGPMTPSFGWRGGVAFALETAITPPGRAPRSSSRAMRSSRRGSAHECVVGDSLGAVAGQTRPFRSEPRRLRSRRARRVAPLRADSGFRRWFWSIPPTPPSPAHVPSAVHRPRNRSAGDRPSPAIPCAAGARVRGHPPSPPPRGWHLRRRGRGAPRGGRR